MTITDFLRIKDLFSSATAISIKLDGTVQVASNWFQEQLWNLDTALGSMENGSDSTQILRGVDNEAKAEHMSYSDELVDERGDAHNDAHGDAHNDAHGDVSSGESSEGYFIRSPMTTTQRTPPTIRYTKKPTITYYKEVKTTKRVVNARADYDIDSDSDKHLSDKYLSDKFYDHKFYGDKYRSDTFHKNIYNSDYGSEDLSDSENSDNKRLTVPIVIETTTKRHKKIEKEFFGALKHWVHTKTGKKKSYNIQRIQNNDNPETIQEYNFNPGLVPPLIESLKNKTEDEAKHSFNDIVQKYTNKTNKLYEVQEFLQNVKNKTEAEGQSIIEKINSTAQGLIEHVKNDTGHQVENILSEMNKTAHDWVENAKNETEDAAEHTYNQFVNQSQHIINEAINQTESQIEELKNQTGFQIEDMKNKTETQIEEMKNKTASEVDKIKNMTQKLPDKIEEELKPPSPLDMFESIKNETVNIVEQSGAALANNLSLLESSIAHKIGQDSMIKAFTDELLQRTLKIFEEVMKRSSEYHWKNRIQELSNSYKTKFTEFLRSTKKQTIRTKHGTKKVISNAIDVSNRIIHRLMEFASNEMEKKGLIYNNMTPKMVQTALFKEKKRTLKQACKLFGVCNSQVNPFLNFIVDVTKALLSVSNSKFETAFRSLADTIKDTDFFLGYKTNIGIKRKIKYMERQNVNVQRGLVMILKNIFANRNMPIAVSNKDGLVESKLRSTLALHEIINVFDDQEQDYGGYKQERDEIKNILDDWVRGANVNIDTTMSRFVVHIQNVISNLDQVSRSVIMDNTKLLFS